MKINTKFMFFILALSLMLPGYSVVAEDQVYGWQLMTQQERNEYRSKMQNMQTREEREQYRIEHHKLMQQRAKERGVKLPEYRNKTMGPGMERGSGMGPGSGMGSGMGGGKGR